MIGVNRVGVVTVTLPTAEVRPGRVYTIKDESGAAASNNISVATEGPKTIDGSATDVLSDNYGSKSYYSDGSNWFEVRLLPDAAVAHSATSGQGTDEHHTEAHTAAHNSGGADAIKLDDLAGTDDNTDLDFSTSAHGLVPKGTNTGDFLKDDGSWTTSAGGSGAVTREGGDTTEATTTSTSPTELSAISSLTIAALTPFTIRGDARCGSGTAADASLGLRINATTLGSPAGSGSGCWVANGGDQTEDGSTRSILVPELPTI